MVSLRMEIMMAVPVLLNNGHKRHPIAPIWGPLGFVKVSTFSFGMSSLILSVKSDRTVTGGSEWSL